MRYSTRYSRQLSARSPRERGAVLGQFLLIAITIVIGGLLAMAVTWHGEPAATETPVAPEAKAQPTGPPPTAGTPATAPATGALSGGTPDPSGTTAVGGGYLLANPGFHAGLDGWSAIGGAKLDLTGESREKAWVWTNRPGTTAELNLVEYVGDRRLSIDASGAVLPSGDWQCLALTHVTHRAGSELAMEVVIPGLAQRAGVAIDSLQVLLGPTSDAFGPETAS